MRSLFRLFTRSGRDRRDLPPPQAQALNASFYANSDVLETRRIVPASHLSGNLAGTECRLLGVVAAMKLTARGRYSIKAMLDLALQRGIGPSSVRAIAQRQNIPMPYLEKLLIALRRAGLVESLRGMHGGYQLAREPKDIFLGEILQAVGESLAVAIPTSTADDRIEDWVTSSLWKRLSQKLGEALNQISLEDLYFDARSWQAARGQDSSFII